MMNILWIILCLSLINLTTNQILNPNRYRIELTVNGTVSEYYVYDGALNKMSRMIFSNSTDERFGGIQYIFMGPVNTTYTFDFLHYPSECSASRGGPPKEMNYWLNTINLFGGENKTYDDIYFDRDCGGACLTWYREYNDTDTRRTIRERLYINKAFDVPIKLVTRFYQINTQTLLSTDLIEYVVWDPYSIVYEEFDYPMDITRCSSS